MYIPKTLWLLGSLLFPSLAAEVPKYPKSVKLTYTMLGSQKTTSKPQPLAEILYDPTTLKSHLSSWTPPSTSDLKSSSVDDQNSPLVRISLQDGSSSVTTLSAFDPSLSQYIDLWLSNSNSDGVTDADSTIFSANISPISPPPLSDEEAKEQARQKRKEERAKAKGKPIPSPKPKPKTPKSKKDKKDTTVGGQTVDIDVGPVVKVNLLRQTTGPRPKLNSRKPPQVDSEGKEVPAEEVEEKSLFQRYWWVFLVITFLLIGGGGTSDK